MNLHFLHYNCKQIVNICLGYELIAFNAENIDISSVLYKFKAQKNTTDHKIGGEIIKIYKEILKKYIKSMELFLNLHVILINRIKCALYIGFANKDNINVDTIKLISNAYIVLQALSNCLENVIGNSSSYDNYFMKTREVGIWMNIS